MTCTARARAAGSLVNRAPICPTVGLGQFSPIQYFQQLNGLAGTAKYL
jgi:hypothetical protein